MKTYNRNPIETEKARYELNVFKKRDYYTLLIAFAVFLVLFLMDLAKKYLFGMFNG